MKHFMIKYQFANGTTEEWHREIGKFIAAINARLMTPLTSKPRRGFAGAELRTGVVRGHSVVARSGPCSVTGATVGNGLARSLAAVLSTDIAVASACALVWRTRRVRPKN